MSSSRSKNPKLDFRKRQCQELLAFLREDEDIEPFLDPVDWEGLGLTDYPQMIKNPMDLNTVTRKLRQGVYGSDPELLMQRFVADVSLIFQNAMTYNLEGSDIYDSAAELLAKFLSKVKSVTGSSGGGGGAVKPKAGAAGLAGEAQMRDVEEIERQEFSESISKLSSSALGDLVELLYQISPEVVIVQKDASGNTELKIDIDRIPLRSLYLASTFARGCLGGR